VTVKNKEGNIKPSVIEFVDRLAALNRGQQARLKRNAGKPLNEAHNVMGLFYRILPPNVSSHQVPYYFMTATLYPVADSGDEGNFGLSLKQIRTKENQDGLDRRMEILLDADESQLPFRLRQAVYIIHGERGSIYWSRLLQDLLYWTHYNRFVQQQWAESYFSE